MSQSIAYKHLIRALSVYPKDTLRPDCQFASIIRQRTENRFNPTTYASPATKPVDEKEELEQANALYALVENRYTRKYWIAGSLLKPKSNPNHYTDLMTELAEAPTRSWLKRTMLKWKSFIRFQ